MKNIENNSLAILNENRLDIKSKGNDKLRNILLSMLFFVSNVFVSLAFAWNSPKAYVITSVSIMTFIMIFSMFEHAIFNDFLKINTIRDKVISFSSVLIAIFTSKYLFIYNRINLEEIYNKLCGVIKTNDEFIYKGFMYLSFLLILFFSVVMIYNLILKYGEKLFRQVVKMFYSQKTKILLVFCLTTILFITLRKTNVLNMNEKSIEQDFLNISSNNLSITKGPLFTAFVLPFGVMAKELQSILCMDSNEFNYIVELIGNMLAVLVLFISLHKVFEGYKIKGVLFSIAYISCYILLLVLTNSINVGYILFYLTLFLCYYTDINKHEFFFLPIALIGTSIIFLPLILFLEVGKGVNRNVVAGAQCLFKVLFTAVMCGNLWNVVESLIKIL